ncbi:MAG: hypothetical protein ACHBN1_13805 [Heteroscytonema crispum UTEX LB 1556]
MAEISFKGVSAFLFNGRVWGDGCGGKVFVFGGVRSSEAMYGKSSLV